MILEGRIQIPFQYAAGIASSRFLAALRDEGRILGSPCGDCGVVFCPARSFCARCGAELAETTNLGNEGELVSWTSVNGKGVFGLIKLDGADTAMLHRVLGTEHGLKIGGRVRARFAEQRKGSILDLAGFEPLEGGAS